MKTFTINEKEYVAKDFDFNMICDMEDMGFNIEKISERSRSATRAYFACCAGMGTTLAGKEIEQHIVKGYSLDGLIDTMNMAMEESDFFHALTETTETETAES